jgi:hypothetical protein
MAVLPAPDPVTRPATELNVSGPGVSTAPPAEQAPPSIEPAEPVAREHEAVGRDRSRRLLAAVIVALIVAAVVAFVQMRPLSSPGPDAHPSTGPRDLATTIARPGPGSGAAIPRLELTAPAVAIGESYTATAGGFSRESRCGCPGPAPPTARQETAPPTPPAGGYWARSSSGTYQASTPSLPPD